MRLGHEVLNLASGQAYSYLKERLPLVKPIPGLFIAYTNNRVDLQRTLRGNLRILRSKRSITQALVTTLNEFRPNFGIVDFEPFLPLAAKRLGLPFVSLDHQHVIPHLDLPVPPRCWMEHLAARAVVKLTHSGEVANLVTSFFHPAPPHPERTHFLPPILREEVLSRAVTNRGHAVVYQTSSSFGQLPAMLRKLPCEFHIYAFERIGRDGNLTYFPRTDASFLEDVASADWILTNGGYTLMSEALFLGKPVLSIPIAGQFEQWINAYYLDKLGFGMRSSTREFGLPILERFLAEREMFRENLRNKDFFGNDQAIKLIVRYMQENDRSRKPVPGESREGVRVNTMSQARNGSVTPKT